MSFLEELAARGILREDQLPEIVRRAEQKYEGDVDEVLVEMGLNEPELLAIKSAYFSIPAKTIDQKKLSSVI